MRVLASVRPANSVTPGAKKFAKAVILGEAPMTGEEYDYLNANLQAAKLPHMSKLGNMRETHRQIARLAITGMKVVDIAANVGNGLTPQTVSHLLKTPAMKSLIAELRNQADNIAVDLNSRMMSVAHTALDKIESSISDATPSESLAVFSAMADRTGHAAVKNVQAVNLTGKLTSTELADEVAKMREANRARVRNRKDSSLLVEGTATRVADDVAQGAEPGDNDY